MSEFRQLAEAISAPEIDRAKAAMRPHLLESWGVGFADDLLSRARFVLNYGEEAAKYLDPGKQENLRRAARTLSDRIARFQQVPGREFGDAQSARRAMLAFDDGLRAVIAELAPYTAIVASDVEAARATIVKAQTALESARDEARRLVGEAHEALVSAKEAAAIRGTTALTTEFSELAEAQGISAKRWLVGLGLAVMALLGVLLWLLIELRSLENPSSADVAGVTIAKAGFTGLMTYLVAFSSRNYRSAKHLQNEYSARSTTLQVAQALSTAMAGPEAKDTVLHTAVLNAFTAPSSGLVKTSGSDDDNSTTLALIAALRGAR